MSANRISPQTVLIVSDVSTEATLVKSLLEENFERVLVATEGDALAQVFQESQASVLVLAYRDLQKATQFYRELFRRATELPGPVHAHRTIALCDKKDITAAYELCSSGQLNDYVQFWPTTYDARRLPMSVGRALQECADQSNASQSSAALASQSERLAQLEAHLAQYFDTGAGHLKTASLALNEKQTGIETALAGLSKQILKGSSVQLRPGCAPKDLTRELSKYSADSILPQVRGVSRTLEPLTEWVDKMGSVVAPHIQDARAQLERALVAGPSILIVDDDPFQCEMAGRIVEAAGYSPRYAGDGAEALKMVGKSPPDLILMDVLMPEMSGLEAVQRLKAEPAFAKIPVIMVTGKSERVVVLESVKLGVSDFVVKPMEGRLLLGKISRLLAPAAPAQVDRVADRSGRGSGRIP